MDLTQHLETGKYETGNLKNWKILVAEMSWLRRIIGRSCRENRNEKTREELGARETVVEKETSVVWTCGMDGGRKTTNRSFTGTRGWKEKQREAKKDLDGQCQRRSEGEKHQLDHWIGEATRGLKESCKSLIVTMLMEE